MARLLPLSPRRVTVRPACARLRLRFEELECRLAPAVLAPAQVRHAYGVDQISFSGITGDGTGQTIAIVDAYDDPNIASDLATFDNTFGIAAPPSFTKVTQQGITANAGWAQEIALDVEWAHAIAPKANIMLVESANSSFTNLLAGVDYASSHGASVVSMSWGSNEFSGESGYDSHFSTPGVTYVASSGDNGVVSWPAVSTKVLGVGGTSLTLTSQNNWSSETGWSGSGGGKSVYLSEPSYQVNAQSSGVRETPDVAYNADPNTGVYVYDSYRTYGSHWFQIGGTSAGSPQWAALIAIANQGRALAGKSALTGSTGTLPAIYTMAQSNFHDITSGSNSNGSAGSGYDVVTGRGSPLAQLVVGALVASGSGMSAQSSGTGTGSPASKTGPAKPAVEVVIPVPTAPRTATVTVTVVGGLDLGVGAGRVLMQVNGPAPTPAAPSETLTPTVVVVAPAPIAAPAPRLLTAATEAPTLLPDVVPAVPPAAVVPATPAEQTAPNGKERREKPATPQPKSQGEEAEEEITGDFAPIRVEQEPATVQKSSLTAGLAIMLGAGLILAGHRRKSEETTDRRVWVGRN